MDTTSDSTGKKVLRSTVWTTNTKILSQVMGFVTTLILVRFLSRGDFGLMAMAVSVMGLVETFVDLGFLSAIIQAREITRRQLSSCFWLLMLVSGAVTLLVLVSAPLLGMAFANGGVEKILYWLAPLFMLVPVTIIGKGMLSRELRLDVLAQIEMYVGVIKMILTIVLAYAGLGLMSLVYGFVLERVLLALWCCLASRFLPRFEYSNTDVAPFIAFGGKVSASSLLWYIYSRADVFVIGRFLGAEILGVYTIAAQFPQTIARLVPSTWQRIAYPLFALHQKSSELPKLVVQASSLLFLFSLPLFVGLAAIAPDIVVLFFSNRWADAVFPLQILCLVAAIETITGTLPVVLNAIGRPGLNILVNLVAVLLFPAVIYLGATIGGLPGVLWALVVAYAYRFLTFLWLTCRALGLGLWSYIREHLGSFAAAGVMFVVLGVLAPFFSTWAISMRVIACVFVGAVVYLTSLMIISRSQIGQFVAYLRTAKGIA